MQIRWVFGGRMARLSKPVIMEGDFPDPGFIGLKRGIGGHTSENRVRTVKPTYVLLSHAARHLHGFKRWCLRPRQVE